MQQKNFFPLMMPTSISIVCLIANFPKPWQIRNNLFQTELNKKDILWGGGVFLFISLSVCTVHVSTKTELNLATWSHRCLWAVPLQTAPPTRSSSLSSGLRSQRLPAGPDPHQCPSDAVSRWGLDRVEPAHSNGYERLPPFLYWS